MKIRFAVIGLVVATATLIDAVDSNNENDVVELMQDMKDMHPLWLRERCITTDGFPNNRNNNQYHLKVSSVKIDMSRGGFVTRFSDGHECFYSKDFIVQELNDDKAFESTQEWGTRNLFLWDKKLISPVSYERDDIIDMSDNTRKFLSNLLSTGIAAIENVPTQDGECARLGQTFTSLRETESGRIFNVTQSNDTAPSFCVSVHVEHAYKSDAPSDFQMIHALEECGGSDCQAHHSFVDGFAVAKALCEKDRASFDILATTSLRWESPAREEDGSIFYRYAPILEVGEKKVQSHLCPVVEAVNFDAKLGGLAPKMHNAEMELFYNAKHLFSEMIFSGDFSIEVQPSLGTTLIFNNRRVLHSYSPGTRDEQLWLQGCYLNRDGLVHLYEKLRRQYANLTETPFHSLKSAVKADFDRMGAEYDEAVVKKTKDKLIGILEGLKDSYLGQPVSLYEHNVQTASQALRGGEDDETVFISLLHDVFETLAVKNHGEVIAAMLSPWISPENHWMLAHHEVFQGFYYFEDYGIPKNKRDMYIDHPVYNQTVNWCENYDQASFDPDYPSLPLSTFYPAIERILARPQYWWNPAHPKAGAVSSASEFNEFITLGKSVSECPDTWQCWKCDQISTLTVTWLLESPVGTGSVVR